MADITLTADGSETYAELVGNTGEADNVTVNITDTFGADGPGQIVVGSTANDGEIESVGVIFPPGWTMEVTGSAWNTGETPVFKNVNYNIVDDTGAVRGAMQLNANTITGAAECFARGTMIETPAGIVGIEDLAVGDLVVTRDHGAQPIRWIRSKKLTATDLMLSENLRPIRISAGALGEGLPSSDLVVSPQHRILVRSRIAQRMFGASEVLVAAKQLLELSGVEIAADLAGVEYFHMLFDQHEVVIANGAETESLYPGPQLLNTVGQVAAEEVFALFPELRDLEQSPPPARPFVVGRQARNMAHRHVANSMSLLS